MKISKITLLIATLCISAFAFAGTAAKEVKLVGNGFVRSTPPEQNVTGAFFELENTGAQTHYLVMAKSAIAPKVELHRTVTEGKDMMTMKPIQKLELLPHEKTTLRPGSYHVMLMDLTKPLTVGERVNLTLVFEDGSELPIKLYVKDARD